MATAYTDAVIKPATMMAASSMCTSSCQKNPLKSAAIGLMLLTTPFTSSNPTGLFIHPFTEITNSEPKNPAMGMGRPERKCVRSDRRSQP